MTQGTKDLALLTADAAMEAMATAFADAPYPAFAREQVVRLIRSFQAEVPAILEEMFSKIEREEKRKLQ